MTQYKEAIHWSEVDESLYTPIDQGMVILKNAKDNVEVKAFYDFILSKKAKEILTSFGYKVTVMDFAPFLLSFKLAGLTTLILFLIALPFAWWLSQTDSKSKPVLEAITALPIVLPPSVLGFYILVVLSPNSAVGGFFEDVFGVKLGFFICWVGCGFMFLLSAFYGTAFTKWL